MIGLYRRPLVCRQAVDLMTAFLDGVLSPGRRARLETHLGDCAHCHEYLEQLRVTIDALGRAGPDDLSPEALEALVGVYRQWQAEDRDGRTE